jgi:glycosyltransferase involved in cell wall biosynthesis
MIQPVRLSDESRNIMLLSSCLPRKCGIATFSENLRNALLRQEEISDVSTIAVNNADGYDYPDHVQYKMEQDLLEDYFRAAQAVNASSADAVSLQHEFGLYGGPDGRYLRVFLDHVRKPVITTFHTVPQMPTPGQKEMLKTVADYSQTVVVMNALAVNILRHGYRIPAHKIRVIPHGIHPVEYREPNYYKAKMALGEQLLLLTFGFLSPNKGIETVLQALPAIIEACPDTLYMILGATHPVEKKHQGETYRTDLEKTVQTLGITDHVLFIDQFVRDEDLHALIGAADIVVCPYHSQDQITSGVLSTAMSYGKPIISTPFLHAQEGLASGRGILVPPKDPNSMADAVIRLGTHPAERRARGAAVHAYSRGLGWDRTALEYSTILTTTQTRYDPLRQKQTRAAP